MLLRAALSFTHQSAGERLGSSEVHLKQQLVASAGMREGRFSIHVCPKLGATRVRLCEEDHLLLETARLGSGLAFRQQLSWARCMVPTCPEQPIELLHPPHSHGQQNSPGGKSEGPAS